MGKLFFDVFPDLKIPSEMEKLMADVEVTKVSTNRNRDHLRVYLLSSRLIEKKRIFRLEEDIKRQLFPRNELTVKIIEKYKLSGQYSPKKLMYIYRDSVLDEFKSYSYLEYSLLKTAQLKFPEEHKMQLIFEESMIARQKSEEIVQILEKIICERCGMDVNIEVGYMEAGEKNYKKDSSIRIQNEVHTIIARSSIGTKREDEEQPEISEQATSDEVQPENRKPMSGGSRNQQPTSQDHKKKRSDNPDLIYGRFDFKEDEADRSD